MLFPTLPDGAQPVLTLLRFMDKTPFKAQSSQDPSQLNKECPRGSCPNGQSSGFLAQVNNSNPLRTYSIYKVENVRAEDLHGSTS